MLLHRILAFLVASFSVLCMSFAAPSSSPDYVGRKCERIYVHKEWRDLSVKQRLSYLDAVKCLQALPPTNPGQVATSRFEEYLGTHIAVTRRVHLVGQFLPWHRNFVNLYTKELRHKCHYKGPMPFWDWSRDGDNEGVPIAQSPIFDPVTGFGGDGVPGTYTLPSGNLSTVNAPRAYRGCVMDGPFAASNFTLHLGPGELMTQHCLVRGINETWRVGMTSEVLNRQLDLKTFDELRLAIDNSTVPGMHWITHSPIGGEMTNVWSSPSDPIFYLSHLNLDRMWWHWQKRDLKKRLREIAGPTTRNGTDNVGLDFVLDYPLLGPNVTIRDVMDISKEPNCFAYSY
ncbi:hypothetical protein NMY22_g14059 [Coprinellus aureogranulatus]|nr:hypothetical protein NMY22_g14059 [Coprinellus aureogranulatus]